MSEREERDAPAWPPPGGIPASESTAGRASLLETQPDVGQTIIDAVRRGAFLKHAAGSARVAKSTLDNWIKWGREGKEPYASFLAEVEKAKDDFTNAALVTLNKMALEKAKAGDTDDLKWILTHGPNKRDFAHAVELEHSGKDGGPIPVEVDATPNLANKLAALATKLADPPKSEEP